MTTQAQPPFERQKFRELMLYIADRSVEDPRFGATKLNKLLFYSDFYAYGLHGSPITGATYRRLSRGPAPKELLGEQRALIDAGHAVLVERVYFNRRQQRLFALRPPDIGLFAAAEISLVDQVIETFRHDDAATLSTFSHQEMAWKLAGDQADIPYDAVFLSGAEPAPSDVTRGHELASRHGWSGSAGASPRTPPR